MKDLEFDFGEDFYPGGVDSVLDFKVLMGGCVLQESAVELGVEWENLLFYDFDEVESFIESGGDDDMLVVNVVSSEDGLVLDDVELRSYFPSDFESHPMISRSSGPTCFPSITQKHSVSNPKELESFVDVDDGYSALSHLFQTWVDKYLIDTEFYDGSEWMDLLIDLVDSEERLGAVYNSVGNALDEAGVDSYGGCVSITIDGKPPIEWDGYSALLMDIRQDNESINNDMDSSGFGECMITRDETAIVGGNDALLFDDYNTTKQLEELPDFDAKYNNQYRPIDFKTGLVSQYADSLIDELKYTIPLGGPSSSDYMVMYLIPFFTGEYSVSEISEAYNELSMYKELDLQYNELLQSIVNKLYSDSVDDSEDDIEWLDDISSESVFDRFYVSIQMTGNKNSEIYSSVVSESDVDKLVTVVNEVNDDIDWWYEPKYSSILQEDLSEIVVAKTLLYHNYISSRLDNKNTNRGAGTPEFNIPLSLLNSGVSIDYDVLLTDFVNRLTSEFHNSDTDDMYSFYNLLAEQYVLIEVLHRLDRFSKTHLTTEKVISSMNDTFVDNSFISGTDYEYPYLVGKLVGEISSHQVFTHDVQRPLMKQYPVEYVSSDTIQEIISQTINKSIQYHSKSGYESKSLPSQQLIEEIENTFTQINIRELDLSTDELRYYYSLGLASGYSYTEHSE